MNPALTGRRPLARRLASLVLAVVAVAATMVDRPARAAEAPPGPEAFFQYPTMVDAILSPDGRTLAVLLAPTPKDRTRLIALDVKTLKPTVLAQFEGMDVDSVDWISAQRMVFTLGDRQTPPGERREQQGLYAINADGSYFRQLASQHREKFIKNSTDRELLPYYAQYVASADPRHDSEDILVAVPAEYHYGGVGDWKLKRVNTRTGHSLDIPTPAGARHWLFDADGRLRVMTTFQGSRSRILLRDPADDRWTTLAEFDAYTADDGLVPEYIDGNRLFVLARHGRDTQSIHVVDMTTGALSDKPFLQSDRYDLWPDFIARDGKLLGVRYTIDAEVTQWLDPGMKALQAKIDDRLPQTINRLATGTRGDAGMVVVYAFSDRVPGLFYLYDAKQDTLVALGNRHPEVVASRMSAMEPVHYAARDGLQIPAWLTVPQGAERKDLPLVVLVHGGPNVRGERWHWNDEVQFLASRGYAVLEPEYRGSTGYGRKLFEAGWKQWGLRMQDDLADGVKWAVAQGLVDPKRVCIAGASYGGYAVLMGLVNDPQVYRCGIDWVGVTDIDLMYTAEWSDLSDAWKAYGMPRLIGDRVADAAQLKATSPIVNAGRIHAPLLMAYGGKDWRVPLVHGEKMHEALARSGADVQWVVYEQEGHGWSTVATNVDFWNRAAAFLDKNIGARR